MFCPQCGAESPDGLQYCRSCGANLKVIGKALKLSDAIARSDRGPLPKLKEMVKNLKIDQVTEEVSRALDHMNKEIVKNVPKRPPSTPGTPWWQRHKKTPQERREEKITKGTISFFWGIGFMVFLYYFSAALVLKLPPPILEKIPFEIEPLVRIIWLVGLIPILSGLGHILAGLLIRPSRYETVVELNSGEIRTEIPDKKTDKATASVEWPEHASVTERTTNLLGVRAANGGDDR